MAAAAAGPCCGAQARAAQHRVAELQRPFGGLQHQRRDVLADVRERLVLAPGRTRISVQVADDVPADGDRLRPQHAIGDDRRVRHVGALDGDRAGRARPDDRLAVHHQRQRSRRAQGDARAPRPGRRGAKIERAAELRGRHRVKAAHQPAAEPVAAKAAEAARHGGVEVDVDGDGGARAPAAWGAPTRAMVRAPAGVSSSADRRRDAVGARVRDRHPAGENATPG